MDIYLQFLFYSYDLGIRVSIFRIKLLIVLLIPFQAVRSKVKMQLNIVYSSTELNVVCVIQSRLKLAQAPSNEQYIHSLFVFYYSQIVYV